MSAIATRPTVIPAGTYNVDEAHSNVGFEVKHLGITTVRGSFSKFHGVIDAGGEIPVLSGTVEVSSVDTGNADRDGHLQSPDFFDAAQYPEISFRSLSIEVAEDGEAVTVTGDITIKGVTKPIELTGTLAEVAEDPWGFQRIGLDISGTIDRRDFGVTFNQTLAGGGLLLSNDVKLVVSASAIKA